MNLFRRLALVRLLALCAVAIAVGVFATAIAFALDAGPTPPPKPLAEAIHDALTGSGATSIEGVSANITLTDHLLEGASLASGDGHGGGWSSSPLVTGASGRLWIAKDGDVRLELQSQTGDTQILYDGHTLQLYDAATNTLYRYTPPAREQDTSSAAAQPHQTPTLGEIEEAITRVSKHAQVSGATPSDIAGQPAYTVRVSPKEGGSLLGAAELSFDATNGVPLRTAIYSTSSSSPVLELAASEISYGPVSESVFAFTPPPGATIKEVSAPRKDSAEEASSPPTNGANQPAQGAHKPNVTTYGHGLSAIAVLEDKTNSADQTSSSEAPEGLPKVTINGVSASELRTELGTVLSFERSGVRYLLLGAVAPAAVEEVARGL
jgi:outer membrane lipoprotein-sorting protein